VRILLAVVAAAMSVALAAQENGVAVRDAWVRAAPPGAPAMAAYMTLENRADAPRRLSGARSPDFEAVMIHRTVVEEGVARMVHQAYVDIPAAGRVRFEPGGLHLMLMRPQVRLAPGDTADIVLEFEGGGELPVQAPVKRTN